MLKTWLVFFGLTVLWIVTRTICLETWTSNKLSQEPNVGSFDLYTCGTCLKLLEEEKNIEDGCVAL